MENVQNHGNCDMDSQKYLNLHPILVDCVLLLGGMLHKLKNQLDTHWDV